MGSHRNLLSGALFCFCFCFFSIFLPALGIKIAHAQIVSTKSGKILKSVIYTFNAYSALQTIKIILTSLVSGSGAVASGVKGSSPDGNKRNNSKLEKS